MNPANTATPPAASIAVAARNREVENDFTLKDDVSELLAGPLGFAAVEYATGEVWLRDADGVCAISHVDEIWRDEDLLKRLSPSDAFRIGVEWQSWSTKRTFDLVAKEAL